MNYLKYSSIVMILLFVCLVFMGSSFASSDIELVDLNSNLNTIYQNDSQNMQCDLKSVNSLDYQDLDESNKHIKVSSNNMSLNDYSSDVISLNAVSGNTFEDIQNAIDNAKNGDKIVLSNITYYGKGSFISVNKSVNIVGNGATLNARGSSIIMEVSSPNVNLTNLNFINGYEEKFRAAGALVLLGGSNHCSVSNCVFRNNTAQQGAVYVISDYSKFLYCNFTSNKGIYIYEGIVYKNTARMSGGLNLNNSASNGYVLGCIFRSNVGRAGGGASLRGDYDVIINCSFISNSVYEGPSNYSYAGALHVGPNNGSTSSASIFNCSFINNSVYNKLHNGHGGALCFESGSIMDNCTFINNYCECVGGATTLHASGTISNCKFVNCTSTVSGGAISTGYSKGLKITANFTNCYFEGNAAPMGGAVYSVGNGVIFSKSNFIKNIAVSGGAIYVEGNSALFNNLSVMGNLGEMGGAFYVEGNHTKINNTLLEANNANIGGAVIIIGDNSNLINLNISQNSAKYGGGVYINGSNTLISNVAFNSNQAIPAKDTPYNDSHMMMGLVVELLLMV